MLALMPIKKFGSGKSRLASRLDSGQRARLSLAMAHDTLSALCAVRELQRIVVCAGDSDAVRMARQFGVDVLPESALDTTSAAQGLNEIVMALVRRYRGFGARRILVSHADLPLLQGREVSMLCRALDEFDVAAVPDGRHDGTNLLCWHADAHFQTSYGKGSFGRHRQQARMNGLSFQSLELAGGMLDIDTPTDLLRLLRSATPGDHSHTQMFLAAAGLREQLMQTA